jgi:hypothetical protein
MGVKMRSKNYRERADNVYFVNVEAPVVCVYKVVMLNNTLSYQSRVVYSVLEILCERGKKPTIELISEYLNLDNEIVIKCVEELKSKVNIPPRLSCD